MVGRDAGATQLDGPLDQAIRKLRQVELVGRVEARALRGGFRRLQAIGSDSAVLRGEQTLVLDDQVVTLLIKGVLVEARLER